MNSGVTQPKSRQPELEDILLSYLEAAEKGAVPSREAIMAAHPDFAADIEDFFSSYQQVNRLTSPLRENELQAGMQGVRMALRGGAEASDPVQNAAKEINDLGQLGDFRLLRETGRGGMGIVYEAEQISLRRRVALKILPFIAGADSRQLQRFRNEAEAAAHLHHSRIVPVFAVGCERGVHFYAMQFIEGQSLATMIGALDEAGSHLGKNGGPARHGVPSASTLNAAAFSTEHSGRTRRFFHTVANIGKQIAEALEYAHQMGVVHRDIKPANLLLDGRGEIWITDFGLAQIQNQVGLTITGELLGTLRYVSPEQAMAKRGLVDHHTDIYSLGATLYELLTLRPVFDGRDRHALLHQIAFDEPRPPRALDPSIPVELETILLKALAKNPVERYESAQDLADDLQRFLDDKPIQAKRPGLVERSAQMGTSPSSICRRGGVAACARSRRLRHHRGADCQ